ncbi:type II toxin-antitoxin system PemK/MazF family toxin [Chromobacterium haemolyticum]|nr:type II toxin-antitoxin system PemK/MazF family toxin [Chromobacterium haemolyticum]
MFDQGDIIHLHFSPSAGREMNGAHYGLVISQRAVNKMGGGLVCPITGGAQEAARTQGLTVSLMGAGLSTDGVVLVHQVRFCDFRARDAKLREKVPDFIRDEVVAKLAAVIGV